ncbi:hypothetical protein ART_1842 [Arthrobacter sp. PAMC 25486]|uniref:anthrone oxygenase family protein n=1 Tax=Arthrobacter sp. PAMC 25486 TaxID=1494608 RepID=UPI0005363FEC|nr:anthrone oxygenase family protein [Arthrobacter sp. PAMC 25486]AIY01441.1 hypothetical protein ART_1842 [Arthrobacter sp. PAMC 25486]
MSGPLLDAVVATAAVCAGVSGGVYLAFSAIIMPALRSLPASQAVTAMQRINSNAVRLPFMAVFFGGAATSAAVILTELISSSTSPPEPFLMAGAGLGIAAFGITLVRNVPLNNALGGISSNAPDTTMKWQSFERNWRAANLARTAVSVAAAVVLLHSLTRPA